MRVSNFVTDRIRVVQQEAARLLGSAPSVDVIVNRAVDEAERLLTSDAAGPMAKFAPFGYVERAGDDEGLTAEIAIEDATLRRLETFIDQVSKAFPANTRAASASTVLSRMFGQVSPLQLAGVRGPVL